MRVAVAGWSSRRVGGAERYVGVMAGLLRQSGAEVAYFHEIDRPKDRPPIPLPDDVLRWCVETDGAAAALEGLRNWRPDLVYCQSLANAVLEAELLTVAPGVLSIHNYLGTCVSGHKATSLPVVTPCQRRFGPACLLHYFPRRCGGLNPVTMARQYREQSGRLALMERYHSLVTHSEYMLQEYLRHGFAAERVFRVIYCTEGPAPERETSQRAKCDGEGWRLLFLGRMDRLKGGDALIEAAPAAAAKLGTPLRVALTGDGPSRAEWQQRAQRVEARSPLVKFDFPGWVSGERLQEILGSTDLLIVPSLWPEPFGMVGLEAGRVGVPAAAFRVGGIPDWLRDGVNGYLAPGDPPTAAGLAEAIVRCLEDPARHARLCEGAREVAGQFNGDVLVRQLLPILERAAANRRTPEPLHS
jgi:glycosyltransferase involved in cell wall biosynthesis